MNTDEMQELINDNACVQCGKEIGVSVSDDFCSEYCQRAWHHVQNGDSLPLVVDSPIVGPFIARWGGYHPTASSDDSCFDYADLPRDMVNIPRTANDVSFDFGVRNNPVDGLRTFVRREIPDVQSCPRCEGSVGDLEVVLDFNAELDIYSVTTSGVCVGGHRVGWKYVTSRCGLVTNNVVVAGSPFMDDCDNVTRSPTPDDETQG